MHHPVRPPTTLCLLSCLHFPRCLRWRRATERWLRASVVLGHTPVARGATCVHACHSTCLREVTWAEIPCSCHDTTKIPCSCHDTTCPSLNKRDTELCDSHVCIQRQRREGVTGQSRASSAQATAVRPNICLLQPYRQRLVSRHLSPPTIPPTIRLSSKHLSPPTIPPTIRLSSRPVEADALVKPKHVP